MLTSIATVSLSGDLDEKLQAIADAGFHGAEIFKNDLLSFDGTAQDAGHMISDLGLRCVTVQPFRDFEALAWGRQRQYSTGCPGARRRSAGRHPVVHGPML